MTYYTPMTEQTLGFLICIPTPEELSKANFVGMDDWTFQVRYTYSHISHRDFLTPIPTQFASQ